MHVLFFLPLIAPFVASLPSSEIFGFGASTTGGRGAPASSVYCVTNFNEFKTALDNKGKPDAPKIITINGVISGNTLPNGQPATEQYYSRNTQYSWDKYLESFNQTRIAELTASSNPADQEYLKLLLAQEDGRYVSSVEQGKQISVKVGANTSILGAKYAQTARIEDISIAINWTNNVIFQNFELYTPIDLFPEWDGTDGSTGNWNSRYDAIGIVTSTNVWIDHVTISDTNHPDVNEPTIFGHKLQRHDGAIDITEGSDLITLSFNKIFNHDKTHLIGNNDLGNLGPGDVGKLRVTMYGNYFIDSLQRSPRVRFGDVHVFNNFSQGALSEPHKLVYYIGMGINSRILSESNSFEIAGTTTPSTYIMGQYKGYAFKDKKSRVNGAYSDLENQAKLRFDEAKVKEVAAAAAAGRPVAEWATHEYTNVVFTPPYFYWPMEAEYVKKWVIQNAGYGKI